MVLLYVGGTLLAAIYSSIWWLFCRGRKWREHGARSTLPPGSMGLPLIGETLQLITPCYSLDLPTFIKTRVQWYGPVFRTHLAGKPVIVSVDPDFNRYIFQQEGKLVEIWYMDSISKLFAHDGEARTNQAGYVHKYIRINFNHFGLESLREKLLPLMEDSIDTTLFAWCAEESIEVKKAVLSVHL